MKNFINSIDSNVHITIGSAPSSSCIDLTNEINLIKTALLYADKITLHSLMSSMIYPLVLIDDLSEDELIDICVLFLEKTQNEYQIEQLQKGVADYRKSLKTRNRTPQDINKARNIQAIIKKTRKNLEAIAIELLEKANGKGLIKAIQSGIVEIKYFDITKSNIVEDYFLSIAGSIIKGRSYPLLDNESNELIKAAVNENKIAIVGGKSKKIKQANLTNTLFNKLPNFCKLPIDEILDIRKEMQAPLIKFRSVITEYSHEIENLPWGPDFNDEIDQLFIEKIHPSLFEIDEAFKSNNPINKLINNLITKPFSLPSSSALGFIIAKSLDLPAIFTQSISGAVGLSALSIDAIKSWKKENNEIRKNSMFLYYHIGKKNPK